MAETPVLGLPLMEDNQGGSTLIYNQAMTILDTVGGPEGGGGIPGGASGQVQYRGSGIEFLGSSGLTLDATRVLSMNLAAPLSVSQGGSGAADPAGARAAFGLVPGVNVQAYDADLAALANATVIGPNQLWYFTAAGAGAFTLLTPAARTLLDDADTDAMGVTLGLGALAKLATVTTAVIADRAVTYQKIQTVATARILGRYGLGAGSIEELTLGAGLSLNGSGVLSAVIGAETLLDLLDVPDSYVGQASKLLAVTEDETGTEFVAPLWSRSELPTAGTPVGILQPVTEGDMLCLGASQESPLDVVDGTIRWTGTDFEGRVGGAWVSMTGA